MSDPVTNVEIEDVLSSIRKLVSTDDRTARSDAGDDEERQNSDPGKLVLTPALRVDPAAPSADASEAADTADRDARSGTVAADDPAGDPDDAAGMQSGEAAPVSEDVFEAGETVGGAPMPMDGDTAEEEIPGEEPDSAEAGSPSEAALPEDTGQDDRDAADAVFTHRAEENAPADAEESAAADWGGRAAIFRRAAGTSDAAWEPDDVTEAAAADELSGALPWLDVSAARDAEPPRCRTAGQAADNADGHDALGHGTDAAGPSPSARGERQGDNAFTAEDAFYTDEDTILDEDALRDLVAEIVRQELQGALGERITRNVRKLVRREIHRALAAQELD